MGYQALIYDPPGLGRASGWDGGWSLEHACNDIRAVLDAEGIQRSQLLGTSMGGKVSLLFASQHPDRVERACLYGTEALGSPHARSIYRFFRSVFTHVPTEELGLTLAPWLFGASFLTTKTSLAQDVMRGFRPSVQERQTTLAQVGAIAAFDFASILPQVRAPIVLHAGREDALVFAEDIRRTAEAIPGAEYVEVPRAGHSLLLENAEDCLRALLLDA
jgi:pimeloyl-ACP methyl ester carboxylesterase